jgi:putative transposase
VPKDTHRTAATDPALDHLPERVTVAVAELASAAREGLLALAVGTGLQVLQVMLEEDVARLVGARGRHNPDRTAVRHGSEPGQVTLGGRRVRVQRPRVRTADGAGEVAVPTYQAFASTELLDQLAVERMLAKLSTRRYQHGLEPVGAQAEQTATGISRSAVSRRFVARTEHALAELLAQDLSTLDLVALMVDGIRVAEHCCVVALGVTIDGTKVPLGLAEGATENATVVGDLLAGLRERGLEVTRPILVVIDGAKALRRAVTDVFDHPVIQRCQLHKLRNVVDRLPTRWPRWWPSGCVALTTWPTRWWPRPSWRRWRVSWTAPTQAPPRPYAKGWPRPSPSAGWACHPPSPGPCAAPTRSSR